MCERSHAGLNYSAIEPEQPCTKAGAAEMIGAAVARR
jgi:hypothetical protein